MEQTGNDKKQPGTKEVPVHDGGTLSGSAGQDKKNAAYTACDQEPVDPKEVMELRKVIEEAEAYHTDKDMESLRGDLNYLRSCCQAIRKSTYTLKRIFAEIATYSPEEYKQIKEFSQFLYIYSRCGKKIEKTLHVLEGRIRDNSTVSDYTADQIADIQCCWTWIQYFAKDLEKKPLNDVKDSLKEIDSQLCNLIAFCGEVTIPVRLNQHLQNMRVGQPLIFHDRFGDEYCSKSDGDKLLDYLSKQPNAVHGIIDVESGIVYNVSNNKWRRRFTYIAAAVLIIAGMVFPLAVVPALLQYSPSLIIANADPLMYLAAYIFVIMGGCIHVLLDIVKEKQSAASKSRISVTDWILWGHINEYSIYIAIFMLWVGFLGLVWIRQIDIVSAVAVGYSIDSVYDVIVARFDKGVTSRSSDIVKVIKG